MKTIFNLFVRTVLPFFLFVPFSLPRLNYITMATERISQILPTVKCSDCGRDVLIRRLGDHLCTSQPPVPSLPIIPPLKGKKKI